MCVLDFLFYDLYNLFNFAVVHASKDKILLNGDQYGGYDDDGDDDEVFALKGINDDDSEEDEGFYDQDEEILDDEAEIETEASGTKKKSKHSRKVKGKTAESPEPEEEKEEEEEGWGRGRAAYYSSNAVELESDDEEGNELEEQEAKRLQAAARKEMTDDDFGLNDNPEVTQNDPDMEYR
jgi:U3 small nucleolar RNA-associated protein 3